MRTRGDHKLEALASGLRRAVTGETEAERLAGAEAVLAALAKQLGCHGPASRRGRRRVHNRDWALAQLTALAASVDGMPDDQASVVAWLGTRFEDKGKQPPGETWLKKIEREFRARAQIRHQESLEDYRQSEALKAAFGSEEGYLAYRTARDRLEQKWLHDKELQQRFASPAEFVASQLLPASARASEADMDLPSKTELAPSSA